MARVNKENKMMSLLSIWGIILVVLGHSGIEEPLIKEKLFYLQKWIYSFHMPLFFMISGYLYSLTNESFVQLDPIKFLKKKATRLLIPYLVIGVIVFFIKFSLANYSHATREFSISSFLVMFVSPSNPNSTMGYLWYVFTLFIVFALVTFLNKIGFNFKKCPICIACMIFFWFLYYCFPICHLFNWTAVCKYIPYFIGGILLCHYDSLIFKLAKNIGYVGILVSLSVSVILVFIELHEALLIFQIVRAFVGIFFSICLCTFLLKFKWVCDYVLLLDRYTYSIYLLSWFGQYAAKFLLLNAINAHWIVVVIGMFISGMMFPILVSKIIDKIPMLNRNKFIHSVIGY